MSLFACNAIASYSSLMSLEREEMRVEGRRSGSCSLEYFRDYLSWSRKYSSEYFRWHLSPSRKYFHDYLSWSRKYSGEYFHDYLSWPRKYSSEYFHDYLSWPRKYSNECFRWHVLVSRKYSSEHARKYLPNRQRQLVLEEFACVCRLSIEQCLQFLHFLVVYASQELELFHKRLHLILEVNA